jgi:soluble lytic murein transglycosylase-like protein
MLKAVATVESSNNPKAIGDNGNALGMYQLHKPAWEQISKQRENAGLKIWTWSYAIDKDISSIYASAYMDWLSDGLKKRIGRIPEPWEVYAAYNRGLGGFAKADYKFSSLPTHTQKACQKITSLTQNSNQKR